MFAASAREAVFSNSAVVDSVNQDFIPVALKAGLVNNPPRGIEGELYEEIRHTMPAPQGICIANSAGKPLVWALSFDSDDKLSGFLTHALERYRDSPGDSEPITTERYMKFPGHRLSDVEDSGRKVEIPTAHNHGEHCPAIPSVKNGTLVGRVVGRALDDEGQPVEATLRQEHYMEARFEVQPEIVEQFIRAYREAEQDSFAVPDSFARSLVRSSYLGQLDVNPLGGREVGGQTTRDKIEFSGRHYATDGDTNIVRITGSSDVAGIAADFGTRSDGRQWEHEVKLGWEGFVFIKDGRVVDLTVQASGDERLRWGSVQLFRTTEPDVAHLMAGHPIDLESGVRYGLNAKPSIAEEVTSDTVMNSAVEVGPVEPNLEQLTAILGPKFLIMIEEVASELELVPSQVNILNEMRDRELAEYAKVHNDLPSAVAEQRRELMDAYRKSAHQRLEERLPFLLTDAQNDRLRRITLRHQGLFALANPVEVPELNVSEDQLAAIRRLIQNTQKDIQQLVQSPNSPDDRQRIRDQMQARRARTEAEIRELLTPEQYGLWLEMTSD